MKPVLQFPIPPLHLLTSIQQSSTSSSPTAIANDRRERDIIEPIPKRIRLNEHEHDSEINDHNNEAQNVINNVFVTLNGQFAQEEPQTVEVA